MSMPNMSEILRQAQAMQEKIQKIQDGLATRHVTARSGGGMVTVVCNGKQQLQSISIEKALIDPNDPEMLQDLILTAVNESLRLSQEMAQHEMAGLTGGLSIPGLF